MNGKFTAQQRTIYNMVLEVQEAVIDIVKPGIPWSSLQATNNDVLCKVLIEVCANLEQLLSSFPVLIRAVILLRRKWGV